MLVGVGGGFTWGSVFRAVVKGTRSMTIAFVFPGQGSQQIGMMEGFADHPVVRATFAEASEALGDDLWALVAARAGRRAQSHAQHAAGDAHRRRRRMARVAGGGGRTPACMAGHSLGEYSALVAAGALAFRDAVPLVRFRAEAMQEAVAAGVGAMAAIIGADDAAVGGGVPRSRAGRGGRAGQFQRTGADRDRRQQGRRRARNGGGESARREAGAAPSGLRAVSQLAAEVRGRAAGAAACAGRHRRADDTGRAQRRRGDACRCRTRFARALARQAASPVRWTETVRWFAAHGVTQVVECGPGRVLSGLTRRIDDRLDGVRADRRRGDRRHPRCIGRVSRPFRWRRTAN